MNTATAIMLVVLVFFPVIGCKPWTFLKMISSNDFATGFNVGIARKEIRRDE